MCVCVCVRARACVCVCVLLVGCVITFICCVVQISDMAAGMIGSLQVSAEPVKMLMMIFKL